MIVNILNNLQKELAVFVISIAVTSVIIIFSQTWWQTSYDSMRDAKNDLNDARQRYYTALNQKRLLKKFENKFGALQKSGIVGRENRLNWVDVIENLTVDFKIPYLKYRIEKRKPVTSTDLSQRYPGIDIFKSTMTLQLQLLHEGDLYTIINTLHKNARGLFDIQSCIINRNPALSESLLDSNTDKNFSANCRLNWYTMKKKNIKPINNRSS